MSNNYRDNSNIREFKYFNNHSRKIVINLLSAIIKKNKIKKILIVCQNSVNLYDEILEGYNHQVCNFYELTSFNNDASFDLIFVFLSQIRLLPHNSWNLLKN